MLSLMLALFFPSAPVKPAVEVPRGSPPHLITARVDKDGNLASTQRVGRYKTVKKIAKRIVNGQVFEEEVTELIPEIVEVTVKWKLDKATITEVGGTKIDKATLAKRLAQPAVVVLSADGRAVDPIYLELFKKDVLVIVLPEMAARRPLPPEKVPVPKVPPPK
jgi:hypothetical protein